MFRRGVCPRSSPDIPSPPPPRTVSQVIGCVCCLRFPAAPTCKAAGPAPRERSDLPLWGRTSVQPQQPPERTLRLQSTAPRGRATEAALREGAGPGASNTSPSSGSGAPGEALAVTSWHSTRPARWAVPHAHGRLHEDDTPGPSQTPSKRAATCESAPTSGQWAADRRTIPGPKGSCPRGAEGHLPSGTIRNRT